MIINSVIPRNSNNMSCSAEVFQANMAHFNAVIENYCVSSRKQGLIYNLIIKWINATCRLLLGSGPPMAYTVTQNRWPSINSGSISPSWTPQRDWDNNSIIGIHSFFVNVDLCLWTCPHPIIVIKMHVSWICIIKLLVTLYEYDIIVCSVY